VVSGKAPLFVDPDAILSFAFLTGAGGNFFPYSNERVDELIKQGRRTTSLEERAGIYKEAVRLIIDDAPFIFVSHPVDLFTGSKKVQGWYLGTRLTTGYSEYWLAE
jgi:peptide/nickel transport system substrate-binding protein